MKKLLAACCCFCVSIAFGDTYQLNSLLQNFTSLQANFTEVISDQQGNKSQSSGVLYIQKPNQFHYEVTEPNSEIFISDGKQVWSVEPDLEQVTISPLSQNLSTTPLLLLSGETQDLQTVFKITELTSTNYLLVPRDQDLMIKEIIINFDAKGRPQFLQIDNTMGQVGKINFSQIELNQPLSPTLFRYIPAPGMSVLSNS